MNHEMNGFKMFSRLFSILLASVVLVACGGGGGSTGGNPQQPTLFTSAGDAVVIPSGAFRKYSISGGVPPYQSSSTNSLVAGSSIDEGGNLTLDARDGGKADVRITDKAGAALLIGVTVGSGIDLYTTAPDTVVLGVGVSQAQTFTIGGGSPPYKVVGANEVVAEVVQIDTTRWKATGKAIGEAGIVKISDSAGAVKGVTLTVGAPALRISPDKLTVPAGYEAEIVVSGGQAPYFPGGGIPAAIQVTPANSADGKFKLKGSLASKLDVTFVDSAGQSVKVEVEINTATTSFRISPSPMAISELNNDPLTFAMFGFYGDELTGATSGQVCIYISDPTYAKLESTRETCSLFSSTTRNFVVDVGTRGDRCVSGGSKEISIRAVDAKQQVAVGTLTIIDNGVGCEANATLAVSPASVSIANGNSTDVLILGGTGTYSVSSSGGATATVSGNIVTVTGTAVGVATITVTDLGNGDIKTISATITP